MRCVLGVLSDRFNREHCKDGHDTAQLRIVKMQQILLQRIEMILVWIDGAWIGPHEFVELCQRGVGGVGCGRIGNLRDECIDDEVAIVLIGECLERARLQRCTGGANARFVAAHQHVGQTKQIAEQITQHVRMMLHCTLNQIQRHLSAVMWKGNNTAAAVSKSRRANKNPKCIDASSFSASAECVWLSFSCTSIFFP